MGNMVLRVPRRTHQKRDSLRDFWVSSQEQLSAAVTKDATEFIMDVTKMRQKQNMQP